MNNLSIAHRIEEYITDYDTKYSGFPPEVRITVEEYRKLLKETRFPDVSGFKEFRILGVLVKVGPYSMLKDKWNEEAENEQILNEINVLKEEDSCQSEKKK